MTLGLSAAMKKKVDVAMNAIVFSCKMNVLEVSIAVSLELFLYCNSVPLFKKLQVIM